MGNWEGVMREVRRQLRILSVLKKRNRRALKALDLQRRNRHTDLDPEVYAGNVARLIDEHETIEGLMKRFLNDDRFGRCEAIKEDGMVCDVFISAERLVRSPHTRFCAACTRRQTVHSSRWTRRIAQLAGA